MKTATVALRRALGVAPSCRHRASRATPPRTAQGGGAARVVLEGTYGSLHHKIELTDDKTPGIVLSYSDLRAITDDVADARVYGGIHFRFDQDASHRMGTEWGTTTTSTACCLRRLAGPSFANKADWVGTSTGNSCRAP